MLHAPNSEWFVFVNENVTLPYGKYRIFKIILLILIKLGWLAHLWNATQQEKFIVGGIGMTNESKIIGHWSDMSGHHFESIHLFI